MQETGSGDGDREEEELPELKDIRVRGRSVRTWVIGAGALMLAVSAAFGGLKKAADETPRVEAGTAIDAGRYEVTIQRVVTVADLKPLFTPDDGGALIAVVTKLKVTDDLGTAPSSDLIRLVGVQGIEDTAAPLGTTNLRDATMNPVLTPGFAEDVAYVWKLPKATELPTSVELTVRGYEHQEKSLLDHHEKWLPGEVAAESSVTVKDNTK
ncbi:hypothetical protein AB0H36_04315 [Kribbella sp. NPDC050820]|uniref:hypothetical protein n=1 Tax=Kribbella sp. NPDC050820 TaxID=3155408 RepID=UPI003400424E